MVFSWKIDPIYCFVHDVITIFIWQGREGLKYFDVTITIITIADTGPPRAVIDAIAIFY